MAQVWPATGVFLFLKRAATAMITQTTFTAADGYAPCQMVLMIKKTPPKRLAHMYAGEPAVNFPRILR